MNEQELAIIQSLHCIEEQLFDEITVSDLARQAGYSVAHFHALFLKHVGFPPYEYIKKRRLAKAVSLLCSSTLGILDIAVTLGFESQESFTRAFKKEYLMPPAIYRRYMQTLSFKQEELSMNSISTDLKPTGWMLQGTNPGAYEMGVDYNSIHHGTCSGYLRSKQPHPEGFGTMMQMFQAHKYLGKRMQLTGFIQTKSVTGSAGFWMRVDGSEEEILQFDNMSNRPIQGTTEWNMYRIVLDVPAHSEAIAFGAFLQGGGQIWVDSLRFEEVDVKTPVTHLETSPELPEEPINLLFEE
ncbi:helix-turn-helix domain-containing protein [Brevibacillus laterosporus]|uniref:helix-turn-helix domain-containing protein n=1 Tax=Brevibacillus laterosporus TaxID=1465 RepID=UPI0035A6C053